MVRISFRQNVEDNPHADRSGNQLELGIIIDGKPFPLVDASTLATDYTYTASKAGTYYFYVKNYSSEKIVSADGLIG